MREVWYHAQCWDGLAAAYAAWPHVGEDSALYVPAPAGGPAPELQPTTTELLIVDLCFSQSVMQRLEQQVQLTVIDHHKTAGPVLGSLRRAEVVYDTAHSGAYLTYRFFNPHVRAESVPLLYDYVQDRDLWRFELPHSHAIHAFIDSHDFDFDAVTRIMAALDNFERCVEVGDAVLRHKRKVVGQICDHAHLATIDGREVAIVNCTAYWSDVGHELLQRFPQALYSLSYYTERDGRYKCSLRSNGQVDCSKLAQRYGGGGHPNAAGFYLAPSAAFWPRS
jgi:oligoribonuclease NrnB/cAMP/cGMP phosphodiesterase (DHH superfamily)